MSCFSITQSFAQSWDLLISKKTCRVAKIGNAFGGFSGGTRGEAWIACKCEADASWDRAIQHTSYSGHAREEASTRQRGSKHLCRCDYTGLVCADSRTSYQGPCELGMLYLLYVPADMGRASLKASVVTAVVGDESGLAQFSYSWSIYKWAIFHSCIKLPDGT